MTTFRQQVEVGPRDGSRYQRVIALVDTASTYAVMPSPMLSMLGIDPEWNGVLETAERNALSSAYSVSPTANRCWAPTPYRHSAWPWIRRATP